MKKITIDIKIFSGSKKVAEVRLEKEAPSNELEVLASAMQTVFLKSKQALKMANKKTKKS